MRKLLTLFLTLCLIASVVSVCFTTSVSAADVTDYRFGILGGTGAGNDRIVDDPVVSGDKAFRLAPASGRPNLRLATAPGSSSTMVLTSGTIYTVKFDYYLDQCSDGGNFELYYGKSATASGQRKAISGVSISGFSTDFSADGKWHTAAYTFTANVPTISDGTTLDYLFLTYMGLSGYVKNVTVITEQGSMPTTTTKNPNGYNYVNRPNGAFNNYGNSTSAYSSVTVVDGKLVVVPGGQVKAPTSKGSAGWYSNYTPVVWCNNNSSSVQDLAAGTYIVTVRYKVSDYQGNAVFGIGTCNTDTGKLSPTTGAGSHRSYCWNFVNVTENSTDWETITAKITVNANTYLKLLITGSGTTKFTIDTYDITNVNNFTNAAVVAYNDNGVENYMVTYAGTSHTVKGQDAEKEFIGWYSDPELTIPSTATVNGETVYAKYAEDAPAYEIVSEGSIRTEDAEADPYVSAGIRFKGRVTKEFRNSATEIGFIAIPTSMLGGSDIASYTGEATVIGKVVAEGMEDIVYAEGEDYYDYQLIITGLTRKGVQTNLLDTEITTVLYAVVDGTTVYSNSLAYSYNDVVAAMANQ